MFPFGWGTPINGVSGVPLGSLWAGDLGLADLPEEVREALEQRQGEIRTAEDARRIAEELMLRQ